MKLSIKNIYNALALTVFSTVLLLTAGTCSRTEEVEELLPTYYTVNNELCAGVIQVTNEIILDAVSSANTEISASGISTVGITLEEATMIQNEDGTEDIIVEEEFDPYDMYVSAGWLRVRSTPDKSDNDNIVGQLNLGEVVTITGETEDEWVSIEYNDDVAYISSEYIQNTDPEEDTYNNEWTGKKLNAHDGKVVGPSGNETFYNLNMSKCVYYMNCLGYYGYVWTRSDGVKMFDKYVMVAADLSIRPKGTLVETTLGTGIVVDTGDFVNWDSTRLDIATAW